MTNAFKTIAVIEDDRDIADILTHSLTLHGFKAEHFSTAASFLAAFDRLKPDLCLVDLTLPDRDGLSLVADISKRPGTAAIIVSGRHELRDKLAGLELGADDYIVKPFEEKEMIARVRSVLRRSEAVNREVGGKSARFGEWHADFARYQLTKGSGETIGISHAEANILNVFLQSANRLLTRDDLMTRLNMDADRNFDRSIDVRISRLRSKIETDPKNPKFIKTVYGAGYLFVGDISWES